MGRWTCEALSERVLGLLGFDVLGAGRCVLLGDRLYDRPSLIQGNAEAVFSNVDTWAERYVEQLVRVLERRDAQLNAQQKPRRQAFIDKYKVDDLDEAFDPGEEYAP